MSHMNPDPLQPAPGNVGAPPPPPTYWAPPPPPPAHGGAAHLWRWIAVSVVVAVIAAGGSGIGVGLGVARAFRTPTAAVQSPIPVATPNAPSNGNGSLDGNAIAAQVDPAIVDINTLVGSGRASGTGQILTSDGEILTNNHVVDGSSSIQVIVAGRSTKYTAHVVGVAPAADIALIQIDGGVSGLPTVTIAPSASVQVGDQIVALGNALGLGGTPSVSTGTVTALDQTITASEGGSKSEQLTGMIESNASISPGDSGGPIVNSAGQVIGMITAGDVQGFRSEASTVNYSIPSDTALSFVNRIRASDTGSDITYGQVGFMGVSVRDLTVDIATQLGLKVSAGALVVTVQAGSPAESAGITAGSVITKVESTSVTSSDALGTAIRAHKPGEGVSITWVDTHGTHTGTLTLAGVNP